jgi:general secretion pathway protein F
MRLEISAANAVEAERRARADGFHVLTIARVADGLWQRRSSKPTELASNLTSELLALLRAGLSLPEAMGALQKRKRSLADAQVVDRICKALSEGRELSRALEDSGGGFTPLYIATVRSSEQIGNLADALSRYLEYDRRSHAIRNTLVSASIYPIVLLVAGFLVVLFLLGYVVPRFSRIYADLGEDRIPAASRVLMHLGQFTDGHRAAVIGSIVALLLVTMVGVRRPAVAARLNQWAWSLPVIGDRLRLYQLARFSHTLAMLLRGGMSFVTSLEMAVGLLRTPSLRASLLIMRREISEGQPISASFARHGLATEVGVRMLAAGERTGNMAEMMDHVARLYDDELATWVERFTRLFEPLLMAVIGLTIGIVVLLMYMPIFGLASSIE